jgi:hypothetical protein
MNVSAAEEKKEEKIGTLTTILIERVRGLILEYLEFRR